MSRTEYSLNALAWSLLGLIVTLTYQRVTTWYRKRNGKGPLPPISTTAYFGSLLCLFAVIGVLFSYSSKLAVDRVAACQVRVNTHNVEVANEKSRQQSDLNEAVVQYADANKELNSKLLVILTTQPRDGLRQATSAFTKNISAAKKLDKKYDDLQTFVKEHPAIPIATCSHS